ncbi:hypothetical protein [Spiroplasma endosymbiont of Crioceris asparagi]|uniref:hypothetical protein n=1 Tax=Spiroplasma endosymbiont of Crioceris asparagi TaxID=3066286 RepID=UPI0030CBFDB5
MEKNRHKILEIIKEEVSRVPGVSSFARFDSDEKGYATTDKVEEAVEFFKDDFENKIIIHVTILSNINIKNLAEEVQEHLKLRIDKLLDYIDEYQIDLYVEGIKSKTLNN